METMQEQLSNLTHEIEKFFSQPNSYQSILIFLISIVLVYWLSHFVAKGIIKVAQVVATHTDNETDEERFIRLRQIETYLSVTVAVVRVGLFCILGFIAWTIFKPADSSSSLAAIGAGTVFVVIAGQTVGILLRDVTAGATMIIEKWFNVGDYIKIEPFTNVSGIVERFTLRSTRLRSLSGEVIWVHNQQIMAVQVTPRGVRTMAVDVFVRDRAEGEKAILKIIATVPTGDMLLARPLRIKYAERWDDELWRLTIVGETPPGREWLIDNYFLHALKEVDEDKKKADRIFIHEPIARYADPEAERRFKRAVRLKKD
ncbi:MAG: mechanosensitive ion channel MscS, small conductance mechanosensitive channel [Candidatus Saccharibacteria bacterium]|nr:mechanosensitive ion channel MscS, small conductance mechanosensitive channel [Candidatus Saccharibacteria bacterium]